MDIRLTPRENGFDLELYALDDDRSGRGVSVTVDNGLITDRRYYGNWDGFEKPENDALRGYLAEARSASSPKT